MPPIISHSERQRIESSPTQTTSPQSLRSCVSVAFKSSQPPPVPSLTPPPPRHYLRNTTSSEKLQVLIQKRSEIYTRVQQAQQEGVDSSHPSAQSQAHADAESKVRPILLTRSSSFTLGPSVGAYTAQITRSASWKATGIALGRRGRSHSTKSPTEVHGVKFDSLCAQRRETMVLGLSEVDAHFRNKFDPEDGASAAAQPVHYELPISNHGELEFKSVLGLTTTAEQKHVEIEMPACDTQGSIHESIPALDQDAVDADDNGTMHSHHTQHSYLAMPSPLPLSTPHQFTLLQRRQERTPQSGPQSKDSFPPLRGSSLVGYSQSLDPFSSGTLPVRPSADSVDSHTRGKNVSHKSHSKAEGRKAISKAIRDLRARLRSNACTRAPISK